MRYLLNAKEMKQCDHNTIEAYHMPSEVLMERAALAVAAYINEHQLTNFSFGILCGSGNNGGDGLAVARLLHQQGCDVTFMLTGNISHFTKETSLQYQIATDYQVPQTKEIADILKADIIIDAMLGIGISKDIQGALEEIVLAVNESHKPVIAIDIPSGISADNGQVMHVAVRCSATVTFAYEKIGHVLYPGCEYCGEVHIAPIGITDDSLADMKPTTLTYEPKDIQLLPKRTPDGNKGTFGKVLVIAGSKNMAGAAIFAAKAAYRMGCGMVKIVTPEANRAIIQTALPEALLHTYESKLDEAALLEAVQWADVILAGPGMGTTTVAKQLVHFVLKNASVPVVLDADALNILSKEMQLLLKPHTEMVVTPHVGEMSRMRNENALLIKDHLISVAEEFAREYNVVCVLKDARCVTSIPYNKTYINPSGNHGMATAGSGDVLSGIIAGLMAQGMSADDSAGLGVYIHGLAGDLATKEKNAYSVMASDILDYLVQVL